MGTSPLVTIQQSGRDGQRVPSQNPPGTSCLTGLKAPVPHCELRLFPRPQPLDQGVVRVEASGQECEQLEPP